MQKAEFSRWGITLQALPCSAESEALNRTDHLRVEQITLGALLMSSPRTKGFHTVEETHEESELQTHN